MIGSHLSPGPARSPSGTSEPKAEPAGLRPAFVEPARRLETFLRVAETGYCVCTCGTSDDCGMILEKVSHGLAASGIALLKIEFADIGTNWLDSIRAKTSAFTALPGRAGKVAVSVVGLEALFASLHTEAASLSWRRLNYQSDRLDGLGYPLVFWIPIPLLKGLRRHAPEFWAGRTVVIEFPDADEDISAVHARTRARSFRVRSPGEGLRKVNVYRELVRGENDPHVRGSLLEGLARLQIILGNLGEARNSFSMLLDIERSLGDKLAALTILYQLTSLARKEGDYRATSSFLEQALAIRRDLGDTAGVSSTLERLSVLAEQHADYATARRFREQSLALRRERGDKAGVANTLYELAILAKVQGDTSAAQGWYEQSLAVHRELNRDSDVAKDLRHLAMLAEDRHDLRAAQLLYEQALAISRKLNNRTDVARILYRMANMVHLQGDLEGARRLYEESLLTNREIDDKLGIGRVLHQLGNVARKQSDCASARRLYEDSLVIKRGLGDSFGIAISEAQLGRVSEAENKDREALAHYLAALASFRESDPSKSDSVGARLAAMQQRLGNETFQKLSDEVSAELQGPTASG